jgi:hypothetical protein
MKKLVFLICLLSMVIAGNAQESNIGIIKPHEVLIIIAHTHVSKAVTGAQNSGIIVQA